MSSTQETPDLTVFDGNDKPWLPAGNADRGKAWIKVLAVDEERKMAMILFKFGEGSRLAPHTHMGPAVAYTISGEWGYEDEQCPAGALMLEKDGIRHQPSSGPGAEVFVTLYADDEEGTLNVNHLPDGTDAKFTIAYFKALMDMTTEDVEKLDAEMGFGQLR